ncbi:hypothetical protein LK07_21550 [Streptomyces pluripotens]|uniref:Uncharacterized protein n=1 Tax=Streptomyces pluripotens TaxID=1355015 RepID=A0A221P8J0_9ACTN|nr:MULTISPECIES: hypothetical protein [Streptomyces]ARP74312.1 hypothetical protein LK06_020395 [Streptomyces pluripotens]ASN28589.1 hypothetical protein LK07_21550 [Streptomyces pluripotens]KIE26336.1 hypothetical protein LK08_14105 [Streptomyces sp. MUSC 125]MCH0556411.1 hypothetical protein [Streptomyces sp. MUM 16J]
MSGKNDPAERQNPPHVPAPGTLMVDVHDRVGEFRGEAYGFWYLRPVTGGIEWSVHPADVRPASPAQRLRAENARANARSRGELL